MNKKNYCASIINSHNLDELNQLSKEMSEIPKHLLSKEQKKEYEELQSLINLKIDSILNKDLPAHLRLQAI